MLVRGAIALTAIVLVAVVMQLLPVSADPTTDEVQAAAVRWVGAGTSQEPRRDGDEWEVDIERPDGSLVEVTIGDELELRGTDEERAAGGGRAPDDVTGPDRRRAGAAALEAAGPGRVVGVERDALDRGIEVGVLREDQTLVEVDLTPDLRVVDVEPEDAGDE